MTFPFSRREILGCSGGVAVGLIAGANFPNGKVALKRGRWKTVTKPLRNPSLTSGFPLAVIVGKPSAGGGPACFFADR
jgi:hypothetical protein